MQSNFVINLLHHTHNNIHAKSILYTADSPYYIHVYIDIGSTQLETSDDQ